MKSAEFEAPPEPDEPFDYNAKATAFYLEAEGTGAVPVKDVIDEVSTSICLRSPASWNQPTDRSF